MNRLVDIQQDVHLQLATVLERIKKYGQDKRNSTVLAPQGKSAVQLVEKFVSNHRKIKALGLLPDEYAEHYEEGLNIFREIRTFINRYLESTIAGGIGTVEGVDEIVDPVDPVDPQDNDQSEGSDNDDNQDPKSFNPLLAKLLKQLVPNSGQKREFRAKAPEISMERFSGSIKDYKSFKASFAKMTDDTSLSVFEKFMLLRSKLTGTALEEIATLHVNETNYESAWMLLDVRYDNARIIIEDVVRTFRSHAGTTPRNSGTFLRLLQCTKAASFTINSAAVNVNWNDVLFVTSVLEKFDSTTKCRFEDFYNNLTMMNPERALSFPALNDVCQFMEAEYTMYRTEEGTKAAVDTSKGSSKGLVNKLKCFLCEEGHRTLDCARFLASKNRGALLRQHKICVYCVKHKNDFNNPCKSRLTLCCETCKGEHITLMHPDFQRGV